MDPITINVFSAVIAGIVSAVLSSLLTIAGLRVHIEYLRAADQRHEASITRAHERIDFIEKKS